jgi:hypothetical protein
VRGETIVGTEFLCRHFLFGEPNPQVVSAALVARRFSFDHALGIASSTPYEISDQGLVFGQHSERACAEASAFVVLPALGGAELAISAKDRRVLVYK